MNKDKYIEIFKKTGALLEGHFVLTSGRHSSSYFQCAKVLQYPQYLSQFSKEIIKELSTELEVDKVISPAVGGIVLGTEVGRLLNKPTIFAERMNGQMSLRRGFKIDKNEKILVVEDVITTGGSVKEVIDVAHKNHGQVVGVGIIVDRSNGQVKIHENQILNAEEKILEIEYIEFNNLVRKIQTKIDIIQKNASCIAYLDCLLSFSHCADELSYVKPIINDKNKFYVKNSRHPVIEHTLDDGKHYIPNDIELNDEDHQILMITGPNMSGKSAILRQVALIAILAQIGSYVPATELEMGFFDRIFTRVGASDNISQGESTFMVEMLESASIVNNISDKSLVVLDEIGRGTSTYDGISIAWGITQFLHENINRPKTLFATHYHELNMMADKFKRIKNYNVQVKETSKDVIFLRKLIPGGSAHSFGIHVAKMAGMPEKIINISKKILKKLEKSHSEKISLMLMKILTYN